MTSSRTNPRTTKTFGDGFETRFYGASRSRRRRVVGAARRGSAAIKIEIKATKMEEKRRHSLLCRPSIAAALAAFPLAGQAAKIATRFAGHLFIFHGFLFFFSLGLFGSFLVLFSFSFSFCSLPSLHPRLPLFRSNKTVSLSLSFFFVWRFSNRFSRRVVRRTAKKNGRRIDSFSLFFFVNTSRNSIRSAPSWAICYP